MRRVVRLAPFRGRALQLLERVSCMWSPSIALPESHPLAVRALHDASLTFVVSWANYPKGSARKPIDDLQVAGGPVSLGGEQSNSRKAPKLPLSFSTGIQRELLGAPCFTCAVARDATLSLNLRSCFSVRQPFRHSQRIAASRS